MENCSFQTFRYPSSDEDEGSEYLPSGEESSIRSEDCSDNISIANSDTEVDDTQSNVLIGIEDNDKPRPSSYREQGQYSWF